MKIKPMGDRVLLKPKEKEAKTAGGIYLPDSASDELFREAEVVEVSEMEKCPVKKGDKVLFDASSGSEIKVGSATYKLVQVRNVVAKIE